MSKKIVFLIVALITAIGAWYAVDNISPKPATTDSSKAVVKIASKQDLGEYLTDNNGMSLYTFKNDENFKSTCNGQCAENWPPYLIPTEYEGLTGKETGVLKKINVITRDDSSKQYAIGEKPLYRYVGDKMPGDTAGDGLNDVWYLAKP